MTVLALQAADQPTRRPPAALRASEIDAWFGSTRSWLTSALAFDPYHVTALIGPSGCGKSTFPAAPLNRMHELVPTASYQARSSWTASTYTATVWR